VKNGSEIVHFAQATYKRQNIIG